MSGELELAEVDPLVWQALSDAAETMDAPLRLLSFSSLGRDRLPKARYLVLRDVRDRELEFHTDIRSEKWQELFLSPISTVLGYCPDRRFQCRFEGQVKLFEDGSQEVERAWEKLGVYSRRMYCCETPGLPSVEAVTGLESRWRGTEPSLETTEAGRQNFGVIVFKAEKLDFLQLLRQGNHRVVVSYDDISGEARAVWHTP